MTGRYLVRLDDACPTMARPAWDALEAVFDRLGIRPLVAVIPDCRDPSMASMPAEPAFWDRVRRWQAKGWSIALHGLHHSYHPDPPGAGSLVPFKREGEFVGLPLARQREIIARAWAMFAAEGVKPTLFIAPSHSFDKVTLEALKLETPIRIISDGLSWRKFRRFGFDWIPQQLWHFRSLRFGLWTVCLHPNMMDTRELDRTLAALKRFAPHVSHTAALPPARSFGPGDMLFQSVYGVLMMLKRAIKR
jgi:hypothetical protein